MRSVSRAPLARPRGRAAGAAVPDGFSVDARVSIPFSGPIDLTTVTPDTVFVVDAQGHRTALDRLVWTHAGVVNVPGGSITEIARLSPSFRPLVGIALATRRSTTPFRTRRSRTSTRSSR